MLLKNGLVRRVMLSDVSLLPANRHESPLGPGKAHPYWKHPTYA